MNKSGISVIICCYNSAARLPQTLKHLFLQRISSAIDWEIIIVDNNSSDNTSFIAEKEWSAYNSTVPFKVVQEPLQGLSNARKRGVKNASYELILFCDDDNWLEKNYLTHAYNIMHSNPNIGVLGGQSEGYFEVTKPVWFKNFEFAYALGKQLPSTGIANDRKYIAGAGMVVRKSILQKLEDLSFYNLLSDRKGKDLSSGGDSELCLIVLFLGYDLYYDERLQFIHYIPAGRLSWSYCVNMISESYGIPQIYYNLYNLSYKHAINNTCISFNEAYKISLQRSIRALTKNFKGIKGFCRSLKSLTISQSGSMKEILVKAGFKRLSYLLKNKQRLRSEFAYMNDLIVKIADSNIHIQSSKDQIYKDPHKW